MLYPKGCCLSFCRHLGPSPGLSEKGFCSASRTPVLCCHSAPSPARNCLSTLTPRTPRNSVVHRTATSPTSFVSSALSKEGLPVTQNIEDSQISCSSLPGALAGERCRGSYLRVKHQRGGKGTPKLPSQYSGEDCSPLSARWYCAVSSRFQRTHPLPLILSSCDEKTSV